MNRHSEGSQLGKWTMMTYLAGDNNLEKYGLKDLLEMRKVGSTDKVAIVAQFDRMSDKETRRYYLKAGQSLEANCVARLPEVNTGDPEALLDFITWACQTYPAERYALVLWNHGVGWKDDDIYQVAKQNGVADRVTRGQVRGLASGKASRAFFSTTLEHLVVQAAQTERAILFDDSSADFLDSQELKRVLQRAAQVVGRPFDLLGFDACLMSMLEVHYQARDMCRVVVGSQEVEPGDGWPYDSILAQLVADPDMTPEALAHVIVDAYASFYKTRHPSLPITQSAISLVGIKPISEAVSALAISLRNSLSDKRTLGLLFGALRYAQSFTDRDYVDLAHLCRLLVQGGAETGISEAAQHVVDLLTGNASPIIAEAHHGSSVDNATGLSIYLPVRVLSPLYSGLDFARECQWDDFLEAFVNPN